MHDIVIRGGTIIDGTGAERFDGDLGIDGGVITAVGSVGKGREEIDATGKLVTPGWVDMHTHYDGQVTWDEGITPSSWHGCTTVVMGNCGVGFAPVRPDHRDWLINVMEGVEDIPGSALTEGIQWGWETFPEYLDAIDTPHAIDFATQVPHSAVRAYVMGKRSSETDDASPEEIAQMSAIVEEGLRAGALGFSTSRTLLHKSAEGILVSGTHATREELFGIGQALKRAGTGVFEIAAEHLRVPDEVRWMKELAADIGQPVVFNLSQTDMAPNLPRELLKELDAAAASGVPLYAQCAGRAIGILMNFDATANPFATRPSFIQLMPLPVAERRAKLRDPAVRAAILADQPLDFGDFAKMVTTSFHKMFRMEQAVDYEPAPSDSVAAIAAATGRTPEEVAYDILVADDGFLYFPLFNYADGDLEILRDLHLHPRTRMGLSDGGAHCGAICDAGMPTFMLSFWTRDRKRGATLPLEYMIMRQTSQTADFYGLSDRGRLAAGYRADVNVIDYDRLALDRPRLAWDLPAGGRRLTQAATGYDITMCAGTIIQRAGTPTGALPGRLVRGTRRIARSAA